MIASSAPDMPSGRTSPTWVAGSSSERGLFSDQRGLPSCHQHRVHDGGRDPVGKDGNVFHRCHGLPREIVGAAAAAVMEDLKNSQEALSAAREWPG
jgi:hypothetical protein